MRKILIGISVLTVALLPMVSAVSAAGKGQQSVELIEQAACGFEPDILYLANYIIDHRLELPSFKPRSYGSDAAYFWLHYSDATAEDGFDLLARLRAQGRHKPRHLNAIEATYAASHLGPEAGLRLIGGDPVAAFANGYRDFFRVVLLADEGESFFRLLRQVRENPELSATFDTLNSNGQLPAYLIIDLDDAAKSRIAARAEAAGELVLAASILASRSNLAEYRAFFDRHPGDEKFQALTGPQGVTNMGLPLLHHPQTIRDLSGLEADRVAFLRRNYLIFRAGFFSRQFGVLNITYHQTGLEAEIASVAKNYLALVAQGGPLPADDAEAAWLAQYDGLVAGIGLGETQATLSSFDVPKQHRHFAKSAQDLMDWLVAKRAIRSFLLENSKELPSRPASLSGRFDWELWLNVAVAARSGRSDFASEDEARAAVEMKYMLGDYAAAFAIAEELLSPEIRFAVFRDLMRRLDARCRGVGEYPGHAIMLGGAILYRFENATE